MNKQDFCLLLLLMWSIGLWLYIIPQEMHPGNDFCKQNGYDHYYYSECRTIHGNTIITKEVECEVHIANVLGLFIFMPNLEKADCWFIEPANYVEGK